MGRRQSLGSALTVEIRVEGQAAKRGMIPRLPAPDRLLADARAWVEAEYGPIVRDAAVFSEGSCPELRLDLHPAAAAVALSAGEDGRVSAAATTSGVGPGYHTFVGRVLERLGDELAITWNPPTIAPPARPRRGSAAGSRWPNAPTSSASTWCSSAEPWSALASSGASGCEPFRWACFREPASSTMAPC